MDFIEALPRSEGKDTIMVVVDRLTKYAHFIALTHPYTTQEVARAFLDVIYRLHGLPKGIVSDRDKVFTSLVWQDLFKLLGVKLQLSTAYHLQSDGQTERVNRCVETYLRCMSFQYPHKWHKWLTLAEWWYNTNYHSALGMTPFQALYGYPPPACAVVNLGMEVGPTVEEWNRESEKMMQMLKERLREAQNRMKQNADKKRVDKECTVGEMVYLKLQPYRQSSVALRKNTKLASRYYGPFQITARIGPVAYRLHLPEGSRIHPVFHVSLLKRGTPSAVQAVPTVPLVGEDGQLLAQPEKILDRKMVKKGSRAATQVLVKWSNLEETEATWEDYWSLLAQFPDFDPWGQQAPTFCCRCTLHYLWCL